MADEATTTEATEQNAGVSNDTQPVEQVSTEAVQETTEQPEQKTEEAPQTQVEPSEDEQLTRFAASKGIELDNESTKKAVKMAMEAEKRMHQATGRASELEKSLNTQSDTHAEAVAEATGQDPELLKRLQRVEVKDAVRDFWSQNPDARQYEQSMIEILQEKPHLAGDLDSLYANAMVKSGGINAVKSQAKRETLESLAHKQQAAVPTGNATTSGISTKEKPFNELSIPEMEAKLGFVKR